ncbi:hypothetical protein Bhyg_13416 [Pseudolycoriella hygida]|uniref:Uncharacterized protein n=1 Tax=Pseudolycoriella hygida TaxID=35572 RepID=A0A9Q0MN91_9DIPT|nr:hypothetical protein Bhyg_13416 [Pseudolycoriella hygida]
MNLTVRLGLKKSDLRDIQKMPYTTTISPKVNTVPTTVHNHEMIFLCYVGSYNTIAVGILLSVWIDRNIHVEDLTIITPKKIKWFYELEYFKIS